ncbi:MAG: class II aldolase/adducin family protein [Vicinamibacterales bacterium]
MITVKFPALLAAFTVAGATIATTSGEARQAPTSADAMAQLKTKVAQATRMLAAEDIIASSGHVSVRIPGTDRFLIGPADVTRDILTADDVVTSDVNAKKIEGKGPQPLETEIHAGIYRARPDVMSVIHSHPLHSVVFTITGKPILPVSVHGAIFADGVPTFEHVGHVNTRELGDGLARALSSHRAALIKMHGAVIVGASLEEAFVAAIQLEENAEKQLWAEATGTVTAMTPEDAARSVKQSFQASSIQKRWRYYQDKERSGAAGSGK